MTPQGQNLAEVICISRHPDNPCPHPGHCVECRTIAQAVESFGAGITVDGKPVALPPGGACHICQRAAVAGLNFKNKPLCAECSPFPHAGELMLNFSETEEEALDAGGAEAGQYLDSLGKTDLTALSQEEWRAFLCKVLGGYSAFMRAEVRKYPPF